MYLCNPNTVRLVQLVEHQIVVLGVVGSSPTSHPTDSKAAPTGRFLSIPERVAVAPFIPGHIPGPLGSVRGQGEK